MVAGCIRGGDDMLKGIKCFLREVVLEAHSVSIMAASMIVLNS